MGAQVAAFRPSLVSFASLVARPVAELALQIMLSLFSFSLCVSGVAVILREDSGPQAASFEMGCYYEDNPVGETGAAKGRSYRGVMESTASGLTCKNWLVENPWKGAFPFVTPDLEGENGMMEWGNGMGDHNYCRNPDNSQSQPWCFTSDPKTPIEVCNIDKCTAAMQKKELDYGAIADELTDKMQPDCSKGLSKAECAEQFLQHAARTTAESTGVKFLQHARMG